MTNANSSKHSASTVIAYVRVSTDRQAEEGLGPEVQREAIQTWARSRGLRVALWTQDLGISGSNGLETRQGLLEALGALREGSASGIVVYRLDRLARDLVLQEHLLAEVWRMGARIYSTSPSEDQYLDPEGAETDPSRALIRQVLGAVAQYERAMIRLRLRSGKARKGASGGYIGGQPSYGHRAEDRSLAPNPDEDALVKMVHDLRAAGHSYREIAAALTEAGYKPRRAAVWHAAVVRGIAQRGEDQKPR